MSRGAFNLFLILILLGGTIQLSSLVEAAEVQGLDLRATDAVGEQTTIAILVEFSDYKHSYSPEQVHQRVFGDLNGYIRQVSYGNTWLTGDTTQKWYMMPKKSEDYGAIGNSGMRNWFNNFAAWHKGLVDIVSDAINLVDSDVDFSQYRRVMVFLPDRKPDATEEFRFTTAGATGALAGLALKTPKGQTVRGSSQLAPDTNLGVYAHEFIHQIGGMEGGMYFASLQEFPDYRRVAPDLYDIKAYTTPGDFEGMTQDPTKYVGMWDLMSQHFVDPESPPQGPSSFTKLRLGWIAESQIATVKLGEALSLKLDPLELPTSGILVVQIPLSPGKCYLIENRQQIGVDKVLPGSGVLIYYVDENIKEGEGPVRLVNANPETAGLEGAAFDIGSGQNSTFIDQKNGIEIRLVEKIGNSYEIVVNTGAATTTATTTIMGTTSQVLSTQVTSSQVAPTQLAIPTIVLAIVVIGATVFLRSRRKREAKQT